MKLISDSEIRNILLESDDPKGWKYSIGEQMRDKLNDDQAAMLAYHYYNNPAYKISDENKIVVLDPIAKYFREIMGPVIENTMRSEIEDYRDKHCINDEVDDCSAFKEHRDMNPERTE